MKKILALALIASSLSAQVPAGKKAISSLYIYDLASGKSEKILEEKRHFEAPNWSRDGKFLLINAYGKLEKISPKGEKLGVLNTGEVQKANNDHGYSFDGKTSNIFINNTTSGTLNKAVSSVAVPLVTSAALAMLSKSYVLFLMSATLAYPIKNLL